MYFDTVVPELCRIEWGIVKNLTKITTNGQKINKIWLQKTTLDIVFHTTSNEAISQEQKSCFHEYEQDCITTMFYANVKQTDFKWIAF